MNKYLLSAFLLLVLACSSTPHDVQESNRLPNIYPDYIGLNRFFIGVNEYDSYEMLTFASWKTKVC